MKVSAPFAALVDARAEQRLGPASLPFPQDMKLSPSQNAKQGSTPVELLAPA